MCAYFKFSFFISSKKLMDLRADLEVKVLEHKGWREALKWTGRTSVGIQARRGPITKETTGWQTVNKMTL